MKRGYSLNWVKWCVFLASPFNMFMMDVKLGEIALVFEELVVMIPTV